MNNRKHDLLNAQRVEWTNSTGSEVTSGSPVRVGNRWGVLFATVAASAVGVVDVSGEYEFPKSAGDTWSQGDKLAFDDAGNLVKWTALTPNEPAGVAPSAGEDGSTTARIRLEPCSYRRIIKHTVDTAEGSAGKATIATGLGEAVHLVGAPLCLASDGTVRAVTKVAYSGTDGDTIEITATSITAGDIVYCEFEKAALIEAV